MQEILGQDLGIFMIRRPTLPVSDWWKFRIWYKVTGCIQSSFTMQIYIKGAESARSAGLSGVERAELREQSLVQGSMECRG